jgi:hypothetical protein
MKKKLLILFLSLFQHGLNAQLISYEYCFDQVGNCAIYTMTDPEPVLNIDFVSNPNNIWQIGPPQKSVLNNSYSIPNVIITDTTNTYPINDTSSFTIECTATEPSSSVHWSNFDFSFKYFVDSDTLMDYGLIEFSPDNGATWIDLIGDPSYSSYLEWFVNGSTLTKPILTGSSTGWVEAHVLMWQLGVLLDIQPGTNFLWRFSFISDGVQNNRDGLMYDNIFISITPPIGIEEQHLKNNKKLIKVVDIMGRETENKPNTLLIYIYSDGTSEKVFRL